MVSLVEQFERLQAEQNVGHVSVLAPSRNMVPHLPFPAGSQVLSVQDYVVNLSVKEAQYHPSLDTRSGQNLHCKVYTLKDFQNFAPLFYKDIDGIHSTLDVVKLQEKVYVFSRIPHGDLHNFLKQRKRLLEGTAASIFKQIVMLVRDAHAENVILRDLKLKKFVFEDEEKTRLVLRDLDDARLQEGSDEVTDRHGCPAYISPEMLQAGSYSGKAADLWSLGIILYTLLVGHYPFFDTCPQHLFSKIRSGYYPMPENVTLLAKSVITSLLVYDPSRRVPAEVILEHPWFRLASDQACDLYLPMPHADQTVPHLQHAAKMDHLP